MTDDEILEDLFLGNNTDAINLEIEYIKALVLRTSVDMIFSLIKEHQDKIRPITSRNIPQFSDVHQINPVMDLLFDSGLENMDFRLLGLCLIGQDKKESAQRKYGENHYKICVQLGFAQDSKKCMINNLGRAYVQEKNNDIKNQWMRKMILRIPIIQRVLIAAERGPVRINDFMMNILSESTIVRRKPNVRTLVFMLRDISSVTMKKTIDNIQWK